MTNEPDIWMPVYLGSYFKKTRRLNGLQHGIYLLLIFECFTHGFVPDDDAQLASISCVDIDTFIRNKAIVASFFTVRAGKWTHERVDRERDKAINHKKKRQEVASKGGRALWEKKHAGSNASSMLEAMPTACPSPSPSPSYINNQPKQHIVTGSVDFFSKKEEERIRSEIAKTLGHSVGSEANNVNFGDVVDAVAQAKNVRNKAAYGIKVARGLGVLK